MTRFQRLLVALTVLGAIAAAAFALLNTPKSCPISSGTFAEQLARGSDANCVTNWSAIAANFAMAFAVVGAVVLALALGRWVTAGKADERV